MGEKRKPEAHLLLKSGKRRLKFEVFDARNWEQGDEGLFRLRVDGRLGLCAGAGR